METLSRRNRRSFRHWTPRYILDRIVVEIYEHNHPGSPWLTRPMVEFLDSWLSANDAGLEFGSGRSTLWLVHRVKQLVSVEHDPVWYEKVARDLRAFRMENRARIVLFEDGRSERRDSQYVQVAGGLEDSSLDFCLVDGESRDHCALECVAKIKPGGILIVDDVERYIPRDRITRSPNSRSLSEGFASEVWKEFAHGVKDWRCVWTTNGIKDTALWIRPTL